MIFPIPDITQDENKAQAYLDACTARFEQLAQWELDHPTPTVEQQQEMYWDFAYHDYSMLKQLSAVGSVGGIAPYVECECEEEEGE